MQLSLPKVNVENSRVFAAVNDRNRIQRTMSPNHTVLFARYSWLSTYSTEKRLTLKIVKLYFSFFFFFLFSQISHGISTKFIRSFSHAHSNLFHPLPLSLRHSNSLVLTDWNSRYACVYVCRAVRKHIRKQRTHGDMCAIYIYTHI